MRLCSTHEPGSRGPVVVDTGVFAAVSRIEQPHDLLLSTLNAYLQAVGGHARVIVQFADGHEVDLDLSALA